MLRYLTAGESHGKTILALVDGFPAGLNVDIEAINEELRRRQGGYGRGGRRRIEGRGGDILGGGRRSERAAVDILRAAWKGVTRASPIVLVDPNRDTKLARLDDLPRPRPG